MIRCFTMVGLALALTGCARFQQGTVDHGLPDSAYFESERGRTFVLDRGEGPAVLLIHGYGSAHDVYLGLVDELVAAGYRAIAVDLPGFGRSDRRPGDYSLAGLAAHLIELLDARDIGRADVIAHSWGCSIALRLALDHPERVGRVVLASAWVYEEQLPPFFLWARARGVGEALFTLFYRERAADRYELSWYDPERFVTQEAIDAVERSLGRPGTVRAALAAARGQRYAEVQGRYPEVTAEALLIWGRQDAVSSVDVGARLEQDLPNSRLVVLERCGHIPMIERRGRFQNLVIDFLGRHRPRAPSPRSEAADEPAEPEPEPEARPWGAPPPDEAP